MASVAVTPPSSPLPSLYSSSVLFRPSTSISPLPLCPLPPLLPLPFPHPPTLSPLLPPPPPPPPPLLLLPLPPPPPPSLPPPPPPPPLLLPPPSSSSSSSPPSSSSSSAVTGGGGVACEGESCGQVAGGAEQSAGETGRGVQGTLQAQGQTLTASALHVLGEHSGMIAELYQTNATSQGLVPAPFCIDYYYYYYYYYYYCFASSKTSISINKFVIVKSTEVQTFTAIWLN